MISKGGSIMKLVKGKAVFDLLFKGFCVLFAMLFAAFSMLACTASEPPEDHTETVLEYFN